MNIEALRRAARAAMTAPIPIDIRTVSAEDFFERPELFGLPIGEAQRALVRLSDGRPIEHLDPHDLEYHCGARWLPPPQCRPRIVYCRSGRRSGKTIIAGGALTRNALTLPLRRKPTGHERPERDGLVGPSPGEPVLVPIVAPRLKDQAMKTLDQILKRIQDSPRLKRHVVNVKAEEFSLLRDDKQIVVFKALAAAPRGTNIRGGWALGGLFNEADFFGEKDASITLGDQLQALQPAIVMDGQIWIESSPWDDSGEFHRGHSTAFGKPGTTVSFHSDTMRMNPTVRVDEIEEERVKDPDFVSREYDAVPSAAGSDQFFPEASIVAACVREVDKLPPNGGPHWAGCDPGLRKNSAALALARNTGGRAELAYWEELIPPRPKLTEEEREAERKAGKPPGLSPSVVFRSFARTALSYRAVKIQGDQWYEDDAIEQMPKEKNDAGDCVWYDTVQDNGPSKTKLMTDFRSLLNEGKAILPRSPRLMQQMREVRMSRGQGQLTVVMPRSGQAHGDVLKSVALAMVQVPLEIDEEPPPRTYGGGGMRFNGGRGF